MGEKPKRKSGSRRRSTARPSRTNETGSVPAAAPRGDDFLVVALGASAGGLEAVRKLLVGIPPDFGAAFVLIQHLDPTHESMLVELLRRDTAMKVAQAIDGMAIERDCLYIIPPHAYLAVRDGALLLTAPPAERSPRQPFDFFLNSLAEQYRERAVCVVLSGAGGDGSIGLKSVSDKGGLVIAQEPREAAYASMPRSAIATGAVDLVLPVMQIPRAIASHAQRPRASSRQSSPPNESDARSLSLILDLLRVRSGHDYSGYRIATLLRRVRRRMAIAGMKSIDDYVVALRHDGAELDVLAKDLLINVTSFFRDTAAFAALAKTVIPELVRQHTGDAPIRVWVAGCATGEEAYSIAMLLIEGFVAANQSPKLIVFASDINPDAVAYARNGDYPDSIRDEVSEERLARFFTHAARGYRVSRELRDAIVFTVQDLLRDPPFSQVDLVSCRNLLIYVQPSEQERVLSLFHFALRERGFLFLGASETAGRLRDHFEPVADTVRVFRRAGPARARGKRTAPALSERGRALWPRLGERAEPKPPSYVDLVRDALIDSYGPTAAVLVNRKYQGLYYFGATDRYLRVGSGEPSRDLPQMLRAGLASKFRAAVRQAIRERAPATIRGEVKRNGASVMAAITARPVRHEGEELFLVSFADERARRSPRALETPADASRIEQIEEELETTRRELEATIRDLQSSNQELTSLNEEAVSLNEEFQSTNEELESSREEMQSLNEELTSANSQLHEALDREHKLSDDLTNILNSSDIATLFLDKALNIRFFTPASAQLFNLIATDVGRPLADLASRFIDADLSADARSVLANLTPLSREMTDGAENWYLCGILPYRTRDDRIEGVVISLADISNLKAQERRARAARAYAEAVVDAVSSPMIVLADGLRVVSANQAFYRAFGTGSDATVGHPLAATSARQLDTPVLHELLDRVTGGSDAGDGCQLAVDLPGIGARTLSVTAKRIEAAGADDTNLLIAFQDITDFKRTERELADAGRVSELANIAKSHFVAAASHDLRQPLQTLSLLHGALKQHLADKEALSLLAAAERAGKTMAGILGTLLDLNQLERGTIRPTLADFPVDDLFDPLDEEFAVLAKSKGLEWRHVRRGLIIRSDRLLLEDMARNLLSNAIRYTDHGKILLGCRRHGDRLRIEIWDTGAGIPAEQIPHIFDEYHQAPGVAERGGLGLGLAIVRRLGELLGHAIDVRSRVGRGSVFSIEVPLVEGRAVRRKPRAPPRRKTAAVRTGNVLVVEDDLSVREAIKALLGAQGHRVTTVANGQAARTLVVGGLRPDLIISDYNLPGDVNGVETAAALQAILGPVPTAILTGDVRTQTLRDITQNGYVVVAKPAKPEDLSRVVIRLLDASERPAAAAVTAAQPTHPPGIDARPTIAVVDDDRDTRAATHLLLGRAGYRVRNFADAQSFLSAHQAGDVGCLIADVRMPGMSGLEMLARLAAAGDTLPTIIITGQADVGMAVEAMRAGAIDFIEKPVVPEILLGAVDRALRQASGPSERSASRTAAAMRLAALTRRERDVMTLIVAGLANKEVAGRLGINRRTVEAHRATIMKKMRARSLSDLVRLEIAARAGT
jgi:two-component system, chemotaxis family, CheB/CheR fusion protein